MNEQPLARYQIALTRIFISFSATAAIIWGATTFPVFSREAPGQNIARDVIAGAPYKVDLLVKQLPLADAIASSADCRPFAVWSAAVIRLRLAEQTKPEIIESSADTLNKKTSDDSIRRSLSCSPADPFLWLALYRLENVQSGFRLEQLKYLDMSYRFGPNEGWIAVKRNSLAFASYESLSPPLRVAAITEFLTLIDNGFYSEAANIFAGPAWRTRDLLVSRLLFVPLENRKAFSDALENLNLKIKVPGVESLDSKPRWQR